MKNQSHTAITTGNGEASRPQQRDRNINKVSEKQSEIEWYTEGFLHNKNILLLANYQDGLMAEGHITLCLVLRQCLYTL